MNWAAVVTELLRSAAELNSSFGKDDSPEIKIMCLQNAMLLEKIAGALVKGLS